MMKQLTFSLLLIAAATVISSCYRMPTDDDYCLIPTTNNRDITREKVQGLPGVGY